MAFVNAYGFNDPARFRRCIPAGDTGLLAIGAVGDSGLAARIAPNGECLWARRYTHAGKALELIDGVERGENHLLLATVRGPGEVGSLVVLRIDPWGAVISVPAVLDDGADGNARICHVESPAVATFVIAGPPKTAEYYRNRIGRTLYLGPNDEGIRATNIRLEGGGRLFGGLLDAEGILLVGDAGEQRPLAQWLDAGFEAELDEIGAAALILTSGWGEDEDMRAWLLSAPLGVPARLSARAVTKRADGAFLVTGCLALPDQRFTFVAEIVRHGTDLAIAHSRVTDCSGGYDRPAAIVATGAGPRILERPGIGKATPRVLHLTDHLYPAAMSGFDFPDAFDLLSLDPIATAGVAITGSTGAKSLLMSVDAAIQCCKAMPLVPPVAQDIPLLLQAVDISAGGRPGSPGIDIVVDPLAPDIVWMCGGSVDSWGDETIVQSPYLNLQAAGSTGTDASRGMLLRWFFAGELGRKHLAKGDMAGAVPAGGFNRLTDDHVILRRAEWPATPPVRTLDFAADKPLHVDKVKRILAFRTGAAPRQALFYVHFPDAAAFAAADDAANAWTDPAGFIAAYGVRPIEIELRGILAVGCDLGFQPAAGCAIRLETMSVGELVPLAVKHVTGRHVLGAGDGPTKRLLAENLRSLRLECAGTHITRVAFICYDDLLGDLNQQKGWQELGRFALTDRQNEAFARLEDTARFQVHGHWRRFNDGAFVNVANYRDRWTGSNGLSQAVHDYVQLSDTDPQAVALLQGANVEDGAISVSILDLLQIAALDFHVARMLGQGHVDVPTDPAAAYIYLIEYRTHGDLKDGKPVRDVQHLYLSLPTRLTDERLPMIPGLDPVEYGLEVPTGSGGVHQLTNAQGYTPDGLSRYIRLHPTCAPLQAPEIGFFDPPDLFDLSVASLPTSYGVEYRRQGEAGWQDEEIAHDDLYADTRATPVAEATPTVFPATRHARPFIHRENKDGIHDYAAYAINLFSRSSQTGNVQPTDPSVFRRANRLLPPSDLHVQLIQRESPLVLTTEGEQSTLASLVQIGGDATLVRLCFNYGFSQDAAYDFADTVEIFFRPQTPRNVTGGVKAIGPDTDPAMLRIETRDYHYSSTTEILSPVLMPASPQTFLGGALVAGTQRFIVENIDWADQSTGADPSFLVRRPTTTGVVHTAGTGGNPGIDTLVVEDAPLNVNVGDLIMAVENMADAAHWGAGNPLAATVAIGHPDWQERVESFTSDGVATSRLLRGLWKQAVVTKLQPGLYNIAFAPYVLPPHPQAAAAAPVSWWRGTVRVPVDGHHPEDRRCLKVISILANSAGELELVAQDDSGDQDEPTLGSVLVNYYPGYRIYLHADGGHGFDATTVMPAAGQGSRLTLLGARSRDTIGVDTAGQPYDYRSNIGVPAVLSAIEIIAPGVPDQPTGLLYATPPDGEGVASYAFTVGFQGRTPFALTFFRADALSILRALYKPDTCAEIVAWLFPPTPDSWFTDQFRDLLDFVDSPTMTTPNAFPVDGGGTAALPYPDNPQLGLSSSMPLATAKKVMRAEMLRAFVGLTEQPLPYTLIDGARLPSNSRQVFRDANGDLLKSGAGLDLAPMARKLPDGSVQFVDFTLGGAMNANTVYFYFAREIGNRMELGEPSPILGPVALVNLAAPLAPKVRRIISVPADEAVPAPPRIAFELVAPSTIDPVSKLRIHRSLDPIGALSIRTMPMIAELAIADLTATPDGALIALDAFAPGDPPYGQPLFYRLAWVRDVRYLDLALQEQTAQAVSEPSPTLLATLVDTASPEAPVPSLSVVSVDDEGAKLVRLSWPKTVHNGTYYVSQLDASGNWFRVGAVTSNDPMPFFDMPSALPPKTEAGDPIFYRFRIETESSGGRLNLHDAPITVDLGPL